MFWSNIHVCKTVFTQIRINVKISIFVYAVGASAFLWHGNSPFSNPPPFHQASLLVQFLFVFRHEFLFSSWFKKSEFLPFFPEASPRLPFPFFAQPFFLTLWTLFPLARSGPPLRIPFLNAGQLP